eukprot:TRINITY_DN1804_c0_g2_i1.p1 TRINITY_DN1804_c0_g2~~TRINITY_DN1804_c0_g2_i1.p1  ORF type:complete len:406 (+),score=41.00 TRINITY_DN1804_c0_g2_i1:130-1347(+)
MSLKDQSAMWGMFPKWQAATSALKSPESAKLPCSWRPPPRWRQVKEVDAKPAPRTKFSSIVYKGKLYVFGGGYQKTFHGDFYCYDIDSKEWTCIQTDTSVHEQGPCKRRSHKAVLWEDQMVVFGGRTQHGRKNDIHMFDLNTHTWERKTPSQELLPVERAAHSACIWEDNLVVFGGDCGDSSSQYLSDLWFYDCRNNDWSQRSNTGALPSGRLGHACSVKESNMYLFGGFNGRALNDMYVCDLETACWRRIIFNVAVRPSSFLAMVEEPSTSCDSDVASLLLWGGAYTDTSTYGNTLYRFDCKTEEFQIIETAGDRPQQRLGHCMFLRDSTLMLFGGCNNDYFNNIYSISLKCPTLKEHLRHFITSNQIQYSTDAVCKSISHDPYQSPQHAPSWYMRWGASSRVT